MKSGSDDTITGRPTRLVRNREPYFLILSLIKFGMPGDLLGRRNCMVSPTYGSPWIQDVAFSFSLCLNRQIKNMTVEPLPYMNSNTESTEPFLKMSRMRADRKPPLAKSPIRIRPRRVLRSESTTLQTPPGSLTKSQKPNRKLDTEDSDLRPEYHSISCELRALAKMVREEFGNGESTNGGVGKSLNANSSPLFERGRFYEEYSARRNDRLKRKKGDTGDDVKTPYNLGVTVESSKRRYTRKLESARKSVSDACLVERNETPRYLLRSMNKENKKPPLPVYSFEKSVLAGERKVAARKVRKI